MFKKTIFPVFPFNSDKGGPSGRNLKLSGKETSPIVQKKRSLFAALTGEEHPHFMAGLLLTLVLLLHVWAGIWLLKPADEAPKAPSLVIMEVSLVAPPSQQAQVTPPAPKPEPPKPEPPKKQPVKKPVVKKTPVIPKRVELPKPQTITEEKPAVANTAPVSAPQPVSRPAPAVNTEQRISTGVIPLERVPPKYPARAADRHIEGWVKIEFTITTSGDVENAVVVEAEPAETFDDAALKAINQWKFKERIVNGVAVEQRAVQTLQFKLTR